MMKLTPIDYEALVSLREVQKLSHDPERPVAALITDDEGNILSQGVNQPLKSLGFNVKETHKEIESNVVWKYYMLEHAERNAIFQALNNGILLKDSTMYGTLFPCSDCARAIVATGIKRLVVPDSGLNPERDEKWRDHYLYAKQIFQSSKITVDFYSVDDIERL